MSFARPERRLWSLTSGSVKYSRGGTGHGGGFNSALSNCELLHSQAGVLYLVMTVCIYSDYTRGRLPFPQSLSPCEMHQLCISQSADFDLTQKRSVGGRFDMCLSFQTFCSCETPSLDHFLTVLVKPSSLCDESLFDRLEEMLVMGMRLTEGINHKVILFYWHTVFV